MDGDSEKVYVCEMRCCGMCPEPLCDKMHGITDATDELGQTLGDGKGQGGLACCSLWVAELDTTE